MSKILIIDDLAIFREPLSGSLRHAGYQTETAGNAVEGLASLNASPPDLILLDIAMPGMSGLQFIEALQSDAKLKNIPIILLSALEDRKTVIRAAQLGVRDYVLKSRFSMEELLDRMRSRLADPDEKADELRVEAKASPAAAPGSPPTLPVLLTKEQCLARMERATSARPLSGVVSQVLGMASSPTTEISELATLIGRDPIMSTRVLRVANSAAFGGKRKVVTTVQEAVRNIGISAVRDIATAVSIYDAVPAGATDGFLHMRSWQHSFAAAQICQQVAAASGLVESGAAYLAGLCHDLGQILFRGEFGVEYTQVLAKQAETGLPMDELERKMLGTTELDLAKLMLKKLALPDGIRLPIEEFHTVQTNPGRQPTMPLSSLLHLADQYAKGLLLTATPTSEVGPLLKTVCRAAAGKDDPAPPDPQSLRGQVLALTPLLARMPVEEEKKLSQPLMPNTGKRVWLIRDVAFSKFDPLEAALASLGEVNVSAKWPDEAASNEWDAVVVAGRKRYPVPPGGSIRVLRMAIEPATGEAEESVTECGLTISLQRLAEFLDQVGSGARKAA